MGRYGLSFDGPLTVWLWGSERSGVQHLRYYKVCLGAACDCDEKDTGSRVAVEAVQSGCEQRKIPRRGLIQKLHLQKRSSNLGDYLPHLNAGPLPSSRVYFAIYFVQYLAASALSNLRLIPDRRLITSEAQRPTNTH